QMTYSAPIPMAISPRIAMSTSIDGASDAHSASTPKNPRLTWKAKARPNRSLTQPASAAPIASPANVTEMKTELSASVEKPVGNSDASTEAERVLSKESQKMP